MFSELEYLDIFSKPKDTYVLANQNHQIIISDKLNYKSGKMSM